MQVIRGSRLRRIARFPPVSSVAVDELTRLFLAARDGDRTALAPGDPGQPGRRLAPGAAPRRPRRGRRRHPGHLRPGLAGAARVPRRLERPHLAALDRPPRLRRRGPARRAPTAAGRTASSTERGRDRDATDRRRGAHALDALVDELTATSAPRSCSPRWSAARTRRRRRSAACRSAPSARGSRGPASSSSTTLRAPETG